MPALDVAPGLSLQPADLWHTIAALCSTGYVIQPYEARLLIADFTAASTPAAAGSAIIDSPLRLQPGAVRFLRAGSKGLHAGLALADPEAPAPHTVNRSFAAFVRQCWAALISAGYRLRDLEVALSDLPAGAAALQASRDISADLLADALQRLPADDLGRLWAFRSQGLRCEWRLARAEGSTVLDARAALRHAVARWLQAAASLQPRNMEIAIGCRLWAEGWNQVSVARELRWPVERVGATRAEIGQKLALVLDQAVVPASSPWHWGDVLAKNSLTAYIELLASGRTQEAERMLQRERTALRKDIDQIDLLLDEHTARYLAEDPASLARLYETLLGAEDSDDQGAAAPRPALQAAAVWHDDAAKEVGRAFADLMENLPEHLADVSRHLPESVRGKFALPSFRQRPSVRAAGRCAEPLEPYGLLPESIVGIARSMQLQLEEAWAGDETPAFLGDADLSPETPFRPENIPLPPETLRACVRAASHVPTDAALIEGLVHWVTAVIAERPWFVPGYRTDVSVAGPLAPLLAQPVSPQHEAAHEDLRALWVRQRPNAPHKPKPAVRFF